MSTISTTARNLNLTVAIAVALTIIVAFTFLAVPSMVAPQPAAIPVTGSQNAYLEYLRGEKTLYTNPVERLNSIITHNLGEKTILGSTVQSAMQSYLQGEKAYYSPSSNANDALTAYHLGEKVLYQVNDLGAALSAYHQGEKMIVSFDASESGRLTWRQDEWQYCTYSPQPSCRR